MENLELALPWAMFRGLPAPRQEVFGGPFFPHDAGPPACKRRGKGTLRQPVLVAVGGDGARKECAFIEVINLGGRVNHGRGRRWINFFHLSDFFHRKSSTGSLNKAREEKHVVYFFSFSTSRR